MKANREILLAAIIFALVAAVGVRAPAFVTPSSLLGVLTDTSFLFMLALAQMGVLLTRGIDLSVAANLALSGMVVALVNHNAPGFPIAGIIALAIVFGAALGLINAALIAGLGIPPIVVTLGTLAVYRGMIFVIAHGAWLTSKDMSSRIHGRAEVRASWNFQPCLDCRSGGDRRLGLPQSYGRRSSALRCWRKSCRGSILRHQPRAAGAHRLHPRGRGVGSLRLSLGVALRHRLFRHCARL